MNLEEAEKTIEIASEELGRLCKARWESPEAWAKVWHWEIPANPKADTDLRIGDAISLAQDLLAEVHRLRALLGDGNKGEAAPLAPTDEFPGHAKDCEKRIGFVCDCQNPKPLATNGGADA